MLTMDKMDIDLSIVKKESFEFDDYGENHGNILDNFLSEHDYNDFPQSVPSVPCSEDEDIDVDWLSSFFDEPIHDHMSGLNPALSDISSTHPTQSITSINADTLFLDSFSTFTEDYVNTTNLEANSLKKQNLPISPTLGKNNPLLSQTNNKIQCDVEMGPVLKKAAVKVEENNNTATSSVNTSKTSSSAMEVDKHFIKTEKQNQQKLLLFMNTPENRAKLAGTNFNIINANLLSKISGQQNNAILANNNNSVDCNKSNKSMLNLKKCIKLNNVIKAETNSPEHQRRNLIGLNTSEQTNPTQPSIGTLHTTNKLGINGILQTNVLQSLMKGDKDNQEIDSGYESPSSSSGSPCSPATDLLERRDSYSETLQYIDIPPHERQPFYLSEEEKRTLIMEGLPVPTGLPLNKMEERALKKVRRKIKNKISAQESRRKKKEYMEALEKKVDCYASENNGLKKKISSLEVANRSLILQVQKLQSLVSTKVPSKPTLTKSNQTEELTS